MGSGAALIAVILLLLAATAYLYYFYPPITEVTIKQPVLLGDYSGYLATSSAHRFEVKPNIEKVEIREEVQGYNAHAFITIYTPNGGSSTSWVRGYSTEIIEPALGGYGVYTIAVEPLPQSNPNATYRIHVWGTEERTEEYMNLTPAHIFLPAATVIAIIVGIIYSIKKKKTKT